MNFASKANPLSILLNDNDKLPSSISIHENLIKQYLQNTKLETVLLIAFKSLFRQETLPKNPYFRLSRSLAVSATQKEIIENFEKIINFFKKTPLKEVENSSYEIATIGEKGNIWGISSLLEWIDPNRIEKLRFSLFEVLPDFESMISDFNVHIVHTVGGGHILKSDLLSNPDSAPKSLEIAAEVFISGEDLYEAKYAFATYVYDDVVSLTNLKDLHLFKNFIFEKTDIETNETKKKTWGLSEIITKKAQFLDEIIAYLNIKQLFFLKILIKGKMIDYSNNLEDLNFGSYGKTSDKKENYFANADLETRFQYYDAIKLYNFHYIDVKNDSKESFEYQPLSSLLKRVFFTKESAELYASFYYKGSQSFIVSKAFHSYIEKQLYFINKGWKSQNMLICAWYIFYLAILVDNDDLRKELTDNILQILSSELATMLSNCRINRILISLMYSYQNNTLLFFKNISLAYFQIYKQQIEKTLAKGKFSDLLLYRSYIFDCIKEITDRKSGFLVVDSNSIEILKNINNIIHGIAQSNLHIIAIFMSDFPDYIFETLKKNNLVAHKDSILSFDEYLKKKEPKLVLDIAEEVEDMAEAGIYGSKDKKYLENLFITYYINEYEMFDMLYFFFRESFFGVQMPNPFPSLMLKINMQALKYDLFETNITFIKDMLLNPLNEENILNHNNKTIKNVYAYSTNQMSSLNIPPIISYEKIVRIAAAQEAGSLRLYLSNFDWKNSLTKSPPNTYQITDIFTVSGISLLNHTAALQRPYIEWNVSWDFIFKGASMQNATQIFAFILVKYAIWLEQSTEVMVLGFFSDKDKINPAFDMDFILKNLENNKPREKLINLFEGEHKVFLRILSRLENRFKNILIYLNMQFLQPDSIKPQSLCKINNVENYLRVFFSPEDYVIWSKLYPFKVEQVINNLDENIKKSLKTGYLMVALKWKYIKLILEEADNVALTLGRIFCSLAENFFNFAREAETLIFLFRYLDYEYKQEETNKKLALEYIEPFFNDFSDKLKESLVQYNNIYNEGIGIKISYNLDELKIVFIKDYRLSYVINKLTFIEDNCRLISKTMAMTLKHLLKEEFEYNIL